MQAECGCTHSETGYCDCPSTCEECWGDLIKDLRWTLFKMKWFPHRIYEWDGEEGTGTRTYLMWRLWGHTLWRSKKAKRHGVRD